jgi:hypothetical protein
VANVQIIRIPGREKRGILGKDERTQEKKELQNTGA